MAASSLASIPALSRLFQKQRRSFGGDYDLRLKTASLSESIVDACFARDLRDPAEEARLFADIRDEETPVVRAPREAPGTHFEAEPVLQKCEYFQERCAILRAANDAEDLARHVVHATGGRKIRIDRVPAVAVVEDLLAVARDCKWFL